MEIIRTKRVLLLPVVVFNGHHRAYTAPVIARFRFRRFDARVLLGGARVSLGGAVGLRASRLTSTVQACLLKPLARANANAPDDTSETRLL